MEAKNPCSLLEDQESLWYNLSPGGCVCRDTVGTSPGLHRSWNQELHYLKTGEDARHPSSRKESKFTLSRPFCWIQALSKLHDAHRYRWEPSLLLVLLMQMLISDFPDGPVVKNLPANIEGTGLEDSTCHRATKPLGHNYWTASRESPHAPKRTQSSQK